MSATTNSQRVRSTTRDMGLRRAVDILGAATAGLCLLPVSLVVAFAIWIEGGRPIFYSQLRLGQNGLPFRIYKFRKFRADCDDRGTPLTMIDDERLTSIGHVLAVTKLDELPQLWNVFRGDMSIVGPRPESLAFSDCFRDGFEKLLDQKPGLVGPCQITFRNENTMYPVGASVPDYYREVLFPAKAKVDLDYYASRTAASDLGWVLRAGWIILRMLFSELIWSGRPARSKPK